MIIFEFKNIFRNSFIWILLVMLSSFILFATYNGSKRVGQQHQTIKQLKAKEEHFYNKKMAELDSIEKKLKSSPEEWYQDPSNPLPIGAFRGAGRYAILQPLPLAAVSTGNSDIFPYYSKVALGNENVGQGNENFDNPFNTAQGDFDIAFVLVFILPLLIITFSYNIVSSEREQGTWPLLRSMPISIWQWLLKKIIFRYFFIVSVCFVLIVCSFVIFGIDITHTDFFRLQIYIMLYSFFWFGLAFAINILGKSSATNAIILLGSWLLFVLIMPSIANMLATAWYPVPSRVAFVTGQRGVQIEIEKNKEVILSQFYAANPHFERPQSEDDKTWKDWWREGFAESNYGNYMMSKVKNEFEMRAQAQRDFANTFQWFSPAIIFKNMLNQIAGTDTQTYLNFQKKITVFEKKWTNYFENKVMKDEKMTVQDFDNIPRYEQ